MYWLSRLLCFIGFHHWLSSKTLGHHIACVICPKKTKYYEEYRKQFSRNP